MINVYNTVNTILSSDTLTKEFVSELIRQGDGAVRQFIERRDFNSKDLMFILENLGRLPSSFDASWLFELLYHSNENIRFWAVKNIGKLNSAEHLNVLCGIAKNDVSTVVKREAVSSIGRMRTSEAIPFLVGMLLSEDPKIVCQVVRALLVFKGDPIVDNSLVDLVNHQNEMVRTIIHKEYFVMSNDEKSTLPHTQTYSYISNVVVNGDVREILKFVPDESVHLTFTSPPYYNARDYSIYPSYDAYLKFLDEVFRETYRITKEGRYLIVNTSPIIVPRISRSHSSKRYPIPFDLHHILVQMGWEFIDDIVWMKPEYSVKNRIGGFQQHRKPLAYKPNSVTEYLMVYRKQTDKLIDWNIKQYEYDIVAQSKVSDGFETTNVWQICPKSDKVHSAIFPVELCKRVVEYYSFKGDLVFDPFGGSGTLGRTAKSMNRKFFLTEKEPKYFEYMKSFQSQKFHNDEDATKFMTLEQFKNSIR